MEKKIITKIEFHYCRFLMFCCKYQNVIIQLIEDGDELYGLFLPAMDYIKQWLDILPVCFE